jgi:uncharacterized membrane protein
MRQAGLVGQLRRGPASPSTSPAGLGRWRWATGGVHLSIALLVGAAAGSVVALRSGATTGVLVGSIASAAVFLCWTWTAIWPLDARGTAWVAVREDGSRPVRDVVLLTVSIGTLATVSSVIFRAHHDPVLQTVLGVVAIVASWLVVNTIFTLRYTRLYYTEPRGGLVFDQLDDPTVRDFAYVAFTIGMTFQVSDTALCTTEIRTTALRHALMSFVFNTVILAVTVNILAGFSS